MRRAFLRENGRCAGQNAFPRRMRGSPANLPRFAASGCRGASSPLISRIRASFPPRGGSQPYRTPSPGGGRGPRRGRMRASPAGLPRFAASGCSGASPPLISQAAPDSFPPQGGSQPYRKPLFTPPPAKHTRRRLRPTRGQSRRRAFDSVYLLRVRIQYNTLGTQSMSNQPDRQGDLPIAAPKNSGAFCAFRQNLPFTPPGTGKT